MSRAQPCLQDDYLSLNPHVKGGLFPLMITELYAVSLIF